MNKILEQADAYLAREAEEAERRRREERERAFKQLETAVTNFLKQFMDDVQVERCEKAVPPVVYVGDRDAPDALVFRLESDRLQLYVAERDAKGALCWGWSQPLRTVAIFRREYAGSLAAIAAEEEEDAA